jgi:hypothetical protein
MDQMAHYSGFFIAYIYVTPIFSNCSPHQATMTSWSGDNDSFGPALRSEQDPDFKANFPIQDKIDFKSVHDVRSYTPNKPVQWSRCVDNEFCVMQVY